MKGMEIMYQYCFSLLAAACVLGLSAQEKNVPEKTFETPLYQAKLSEPYYWKTSGVFDLRFNGKKLGGGYLILADGIKDGKNHIRIATLPNLEYTTTRKDDELVLKNRRQMAPKDRKDEIWAVMEETITLKPQAIQFAVTVTADRDIQFNRFRNILFEVHNVVPVNDIENATMEASKADGTSDMAMVEPKEKFDKTKWPVKGNYQSVRIAGEKDIITFRAGKNAVIRVVHYGGSGIEIYGAYHRANPDRRSFILKKGDKLEWDYSIEFEKL